jgi:hypothetical protein
MDKVQNLAIPSDMHPRQNRLESSRLKVFENGAKKNICSSEEKVTRMEKALHRAMVNFHNLYSASNITRMII